MQSFGSDKLSDSLIVLNWCCKLSVETAYTVINKVIVCVGMKYENFTHKFISNVTSYIAWAIRSIRISSANHSISDILLRVRSACILVYDLYDRLL